VYRTDAFEKKIWITKNNSRNYATKNTTRTWKTCLRDGRTCRHSGRRNDADDARLVKINVTLQKPCAASKHFDATRGGRITRCLDEYTNNLGNRARFNFTGISRSLRAKRKSVQLSIYASMCFQTISPRKYYRLNPFCRARINAVIPLDLAEREKTPFKRVFIGFETNSSCNDRVRSIRTVRLVLRYWREDADFIPRGNFFFQKIKTIIHMLN